MVPQGRIRTLSFCALATLLAPLSAIAQSTAYAPYGGAVPTPVSQQGVLLASTCNGGGGYGSGVSAGYGSGYGSGYANGGGGAGYACQPAPSWYASAAGLYLSRSDAKRVWTSYDASNNQNQLMNTQDAGTDFEGGAEFHVGRYVAGNRWALDLGYWSINNFEGAAEQNDTGFATGISSVLLFDDLEFGVGDPLSNYVDNSASHRIYRENEIHNVELNLLEAPGFNNGCSPWSHQMLFGVRYFKFDEELNFDALESGFAWGDNGGANELRMSSRTKNDLIGAQVGCILRRQLGCKMNFVVTPKFGIYNNHVENHFDVRRGDGTVAVPSGAAAGIGTYPVEGSGDVVSFLSEVNLGLEYQVSRCWSAYGGYRVMAITGLALADDQISQGIVVDIPEIADIDTNGCVVLHGAYFGVTRCF